MIIKKLFIAFILIYSANIYSSDKFLVKNIHFQGLKRIPEDVALLNIPININDNITNKDIKNIIYSLYNTGNFENIKVLKEENSLIISLKERPIISNITLSGFESIKKEIIQKFLQEKGIQINKIFNPFSIFRIEKLLNELYYDIGKYNAILKINVKSLLNNYVDIDLTIKEGEFSKIKKINIIGNHDFSKEELISNFELNDKISWWNFKNNKKYEKQKLLIDLENLNKFYHNKGYARFNIQSIQKNLTYDKKYIYIIINIFEGNKYNISNIKIQGDIDNYFSEINKIIKINSGTLYNVDDIIKLESDIKQKLGCYGYIYPQIYTRLKINDYNKTIEINLNVNKGQKFFVNKIIFEGNEITKDSVLRREIYQTENSLFDLFLINKGKYNIIQLGYFEKVDVKIIPIYNIKNKVNIYYQVKERNTGNLKIGFGFGSENGSSFQLKIKKDNLFGNGNSISVISNKNSSNTYYELLIVNPYITNNRINFSSKIFYNNSNKNNIYLPNYDINSYGLNLETNIPFNEKNLFNFGLDYKHNYLKNVKSQVTILRNLNSIGIYPKIYSDKKLNDNINLKIDDFLFSLGWSYNNIDIANFPTFGSYIDLSGKITIPGSYNKYYQITFDSKKYIPLTKIGDWVLINKTHIGFSDGLNKKYTPFYNNFYSGGIDTIRGFYNNTIGPKAAYYVCDVNSYNYKDCKINKSNDAIGGNAMISTSTELVIPNFLIKEKYTNLVRTSLFIDSGTVWDSRWENSQETKLYGIPDYSNPYNIRISGGISLKWISPIGPLEFSYSYPFKIDNDDKLEPFQFHFGKTW